MKDLQVIAENRLKKTMFGNKHFNLTRFANLIKIEICQLLKNYCEFISEEASLEVTLDDDGEYNIIFSCNPKRLKLMQILPENDLI